MIKKSHLGDGVYFEVKYGAVVLSTERDALADEENEDGWTRIVLEREVLEALDRARANAARKA